MKKDLSHFEKKLQEERDVLVNELKDISVSAGTKDKDGFAAVPDMEIDAADSNEVSDRIESFESNTALVQELESRLKEIDHAINKIKAGKYGICEVSAEPIEEDRLEANPAARTCKKHLNNHLATPEV